MYAPIKLTYVQHGVAEFCNWLIYKGKAVYNPLVAIKKILNKNYTDVLSTVRKWSEYTDAWEQVMYAVRDHFWECVKMAAIWNEWSLEYAEYIFRTMEAYTRMSHSQAKKLLKPKTVTLEDFYVGGGVFENLSKTTTEIKSTNTTHCLAKAMNVITAVYNEKANYDSSAKSRIFERAVASRNGAPQETVLCTGGPSHLPEFTITVSYLSNQICVSKCPSKQAAVAAAYTLLEKGATQAKAEKNVSQTQTNDVVIIQAELRRCKESLALTTRENIDNQAEMRQLREELEKTKLARDRAEINLKKVLDNKEQLERDYMCTINTLEDKLARFGRDIHDRRVTKKLLECYTSKIVRYKEWMSQLHYNGAEIPDYDSFAEGFKPVHKEFDQAFKELKRFMETIVTADSEDYVNALAEAWNRLMHATNGNIETKHELKATLDGIPVKIHQVVHAISQKERNKLTHALNGNQYKGHKRGEKKELKTEKKKIERAVVKHAEKRLERRIKAHPVKKTEKLPYKPYGIKDIEPVQRFTPQMKMLKKVIVKKGPANKAQQIMAWIQLPQIMKPIRLPSRYSAVKTAICNPTSKIVFPWTKSTTDSFLSYADAFLAIFPSLERAMVLYNPNVSGSAWQYIAMGVDDNDASSTFVESAPSTSFDAIFVNANLYAPVRVAFMVPSSSPLFPYQPHKSMLLPGDDQINPAYKYFIFGQNTTVKLIAFFENAVTLSVRLVSVGKQGESKEVWETTCVGTGGTTTYTLDFGGPIQQGYYAFEWALSTPGTLSVSQLSIQGNQAVFEHHTVHQFDANVGVIMGSRSMANAICYTNTASVLDSQGKSICAQIPEGRDWWEFVEQGTNASPVDVIGEVYQGVIQGARKGEYTYMKPADTKDELFHTYTSTDNGNLLMAGYPIRGTRFNVIAMNITNTDGQDGYLQFTQTPEYQTTDQWREQRESQYEPEDWELALKMIRDAPQVFENPTHVASILKNIANFGTSVIDGVEKYGPLARTLASFFM